MKLHEAIVHAREVTKRDDMCEECKAEHSQLADWLEELETLQKQKADTIVKLKAIVEQLEWCGYECEGGPLHMNIEFMNLKKLANGEW